MGKPCPVIMGLAPIIRGRFVVCIRVTSYLTTLGTALLVKRNAMILDVGHIKQYWCCATNKRETKMKSVESLAQSGQV